MRPEGDKMNDDNRLGLSIITNFGCDTGCSYCVWNLHPLKDFKGPYDFNKLSRILSFFPQEKISISGGGDPLYKFPDCFQNWGLKWWYEKLFEICNKKIDIHTSKLISDEIFIKRFNRYVLHVNYKRFQEYKDRLYDFPIPLRLVCVLMPPFGDDREDVETAFSIKCNIDDMVKFAKEINCQLSLRQYYHPYHYQTRIEHKLIEYIEWHSSKNSKIRFIEQNDYNVYYMPNNRLYGDFMCKKGYIL